MLLRFKERPAWLLDELALVMKLSPLVLRKSVIFWASQGQCRGIGGNCLIPVLPFLAGCATDIWPRTILYSH